MTSAGSTATLAESAGSTWVRRLVATLVLVGCAGVLTVAFRLQPDPSGVGTHRQLGLPECSMYVKTGTPCPTCGMTTAFSYAIRGRLIRAFVTQPAGVAFALLTVVVAFAAAYVVATGWNVRPYLRRLVGPWMIWLAAALFVGSWAYKCLAVHNGWFAAAGG